MWKILVKKIIIGFNNHIQFGGGGNTEFLLKFSWLSVHLRSISFQILGVVGSVVVVQILRKQSFSCYTLILKLDKHRV